MARYTSSTTSSSRSGFFARHQQRAASELSTNSTANNANGRNFGTSSNYGSNGRLSLSDVADSSGGKFSSVSKPRRVSLYS